MVTLRNAVAAFLRNGDRYLLIKRGNERLIAPGMWSGVGGHMEQGEINEPLMACYREIKEETGIDRDDISSLRLFYIITRRRGDEIRQSYIYFGETVKKKFTGTDEGELFWVGCDELLDREYSATFTAMLTHYVNRNVDDTAVYVGVAEDDCGRLRMIWAKCEDFEE